MMSNDVPPQCRQCAEKKFQTQFFHSLKTHPSEIDKRANRRYSTHFSACIRLYASICTYKRPTCIVDDFDDDHDDDDGADECMQYTYTHRVHTNGEKNSAAYVAILV